MDTKTAIKVIAPLGQIGMQIFRSDPQYQYLLAQKLAEIGKPVEQLTIREVLQALRDASAKYEEKPREH